MREGVPIGLMQNDELFNLLCSLALSGGADVRTLFMVAQGAGIEDAFIARLRKYGIVDPVPSQQMRLMFNAGD